MAENSQTPSQQSSRIHLPPPHTPVHSDTLLPLEVLPSYRAQEAVIENINLVRQPSSYKYNNLYYNSNRLESKSMSQVSTADSKKKISNNAYYDLKSSSQVVQTPIPIITNSRSPLADTINLAPKPPPLETIFQKHNTKTLTRLNEPTTSTAYELRSSKYTLQSSTSSESSQTHNTSTRNQGTQTMVTAPSLLQIEMPPGYKTLKPPQDICASNHSVLTPTRTVPSLPSAPEKSENSLSLSMSVSTPSAAITIIENISRCDQPQRVNPVTRNVARLIMNGLTKVIPFIKSYVSKSSEPRP
ncbi:histone H3.v1-like [Hyposmocoma kahamanoa]|uniref:histone H3.v1-like n=1 Tax=Hyposmocoma kahamanoa TaxID=1477025 RepID=UPI000E6DA2FE|nr:histone H3.v1-like [Hyposmocoma kahamanoa]